MVRRQLDVRTKTMSPAALTCRTIGHADTLVPVKPERRMELRQLGQYAIRMVCLRACSRWREQVFDVATDELVYTRGGYTDPSTYLVQKHGTGRLPRKAARSAFRRVVGEPTVDPDILDVPARTPKVRRPAVAQKSVPAKKTPEPAAVARKATPAKRAEPAKSTAAVPPPQRKRKAPTKTTAPKVAFSS